MCHYKLQQSDSYLGTTNLECAHGYHAPIRKLSNESWIDLQTNNIVTLEDHMWYPGQPNGKNIEECGKYLSNSRGFADTTCTYSDCFICAWKTAPTFRDKYFSFFSHPNGH